MATKAELENELSKLRAELSESKKMATMSKTSRSPDGTDEASTGAGADEDLVNNDILASIEEGHWDTVFQQAVKEIESFSEKKPVLMALAVFGVGFLLGRSGRRT